MKNNQVFLNSKKAEKIISEQLEILEGPFLEIGPGKGTITKLIKEPYVGIESDSNFKEHLKSRNVIFGNFLKLDPINNFKTVVSNLPFDISFLILKRLYIHYPKITTYLLIIPRHLKENFISGTKLGLTLKNMFEFKNLLNLDESDFKPKVKVKANLVLLKRKEKDTNLEELLKYIKNQKKMLRSQFKFADSKKLYQKRLEHISQEELELILEDFKKFNI